MRFRLSVPRARRAAVLAVSLAVSTPAAAGAGAGAAAPRSTDPAWSVAMHLHASLSEGSGSMEWHADLARQYGLDAIWWTDHDWRVAHTNHTRRFDFETATLLPGGASVSEPDDAYAGETRSLQRKTFGDASYTLALVDSTAYDGGRSLRLRAWDAYGTSQFREARFHQIGSRYHNMYALSCRPHLRFALRPDALDASDARFFVELRLSDHPEGPHVLRYVVGTSEGEDADTVVLPWTPGAWTSYDLDLAADAIARFTGGAADTVRAEDNSLFEIMFGLEVRDGADAVVFLDDIRYEPDPARDGPALMDWTRSAAAWYEAVYPGPVHFVGTEISWFRAQPHMNGFAPDLQLVDYAGHAWSEPLDWAVDQVHDQGGAVSLNHPFGVGVYGDPGESEESRQARILHAKNELLAGRVWGADVLEVGYRWRMGITLAGHLALWDALTANAVFLCGNGVTDSHGIEPFTGWGPWIPGDPEHENNFVTWFRAPALTEADLVRAMRAGRAWFGDPYELGWDATIDLVTDDGFETGRVVLTDRASHDLVVTVDPLPAGATVRLLHGEIRDDPPVPYLEPVWLRDEILPGTGSGAAFRDTVTIDTSLPGFARVEVRTAAGDAIGLSNPVHFVRGVPAAGVPGPRVAARLEDLRLLDADGLTLRDASWEASPPRLVVALDEDAPGTGVLLVDSGSLGPPSSVMGGGTVSWDWEDGLLTLVGFEGAGSVVTVRWGAVDAGAPAVAARPAEMALSPGRPNPFGAGLVADVALPDPAFATVEVLDVSGRRVRVLHDDRLEAGVHRIAWDGRDHYGRPVTAGVYLLRLRAGGRSLTTKAVKLR